jgi:hypothetical protein
LYEFFVHLQHPTYRLVVRADQPFPSGTTREDWRPTRRRETDDVNAEVREAVDRDGYFAVPDRAFAVGDSETMKGPVSGPRNRI